MKKNLLKKALVIVAAAALAATAYVAATTDYFDKTVIVLKDGRLITADKTWDSGSELMYENEEETFFIDRQDIDRIEGRRFAHLLLSIKNWVTSVVRRCSNLASRWVEANSESDLSPLRNPVIALAVVGVLLVALALRLVRMRPAPETDAPESPPPVKSSSSWPPSRPDVVRFFLNLYRQQLNAPPDAHTEFIPLAADGSSPNDIYELRVRHQGDWVSRRMSIGPLGEDSGSKSKCYYVIYDVHLVVKIPARPITDFEEYIANIAKEGQIVDQLAPKECIIPKVSVILSQIHSLPLLGEVSSELVEQKYVEWLQKAPEHIDCLKINDGFVYFMDLSKYFFLGHIINSLHDLNKAVPAEIMDNHEIIWDSSKFKGRYGDENETVCFEIRDIYNKCESEIQALVRKSAPGTRVTPFNLQTWFLSHLAMGRINARESGLSADLIEEIDRQFRKVLAANRKAVEAYRETIRRYVGRLRVEQDRLVMASIGANLMDLLAWLGIKQIAMRDLKPDNLLVAGDPQKYPFFLRSASEYSLGIIDVETAVDYKEIAHRPIKQPLLGGTPFYATPSHFVRNEALAQTYGDLGSIFHLQDWYAVMVMIYRVVTGELLFDQTAKLFADIKNRLVASIRRSGSETAVIESISRQFWRCAGLEFQSKVRAHDAALKKVQVAVSPDAGDLLRRWLQKDIAVIHRAVNKLVTTHPALAGEANREFLLKADSGKVCQLAAELNANAKKSPNPNSSRSQALAVFNKLATQKLLLARKTQLVERLSRENPYLSAHELLIVLFNTVLKAMYREEWQGMHTEPTAPACQSRDEVTLATTL